MNLIAGLIIRFFCSMGGFGKNPLNRVQQGLVIDWFPEVTCGAGNFCLVTGFGGIESRDDNPRQIIPSGLKFRIELQTAHTLQHYVDNHAGILIDAFEIKQLFG